MIDYRENNKWTVYVHIVPKEISGNSNDKYYVGITSQEPESRWGSVGNGYIKNKHFTRAIKKYGWKNLVHEIIAEYLTKDEACEFEKKLIKELNSNNPMYGYNHTIGGEGKSYGFEDLTGQTFGYLLINNLSKETGNNGERKWDCTCLLCGKQTTKFENTLKDGTTVSCGCYGAEYCKTCAVTHGKSYEKIYEKYTTMKRNCYKENFHGYKLYGGKGITICHEWLSDFIDFYNWSMNNGYSDDKIIYLKDRCMEFSPENCLWITKSEFSKIRCKKREKQIIYKDKTHSISEWAEIIGTSKANLQNALRKKSFEEAFLFYMNKKEERYVNS